MTHHGGGVAGLPALVLTVSDGVAAGTREDLGGPVLGERLTSLGFDVRRDLVADDPDEIERLVTGAADTGTRLVVTTGGTGLGPRDRTPEAIGRISEYLVPGFGEVMRAVGRTSTPLASLSRSLAAVRGETLIVCVPGSPGGAAESLDAVADLLPHTLDTLVGRTAHQADPR